MAGKCKYCSFKFVDGNASKTFQHLQNRHDKLLCIVCNECFKWNEHGIALKAHFKNFKNKHRGFSFCNKKKCLNRIFQTEAKHRCVHPLPPPQQPKQRKRHGKQPEEEAEEEAEEEENEEEAEAEEAEVEGDEEEEEEEEEEEDEDE